MRLAHLSDLHLLSLDGVRFRDFVNKRLTGAANILLNRGRHYRTDVFDALVDDLNGQTLDHVACTGDVTNLALESEFRFARRRFERIALGAGHVTCVPGNHDTYIAEVAGLFETTFAPYCEPDEDWRWTSGPRWPVVRVRGDLALIGLSTSQPSPWFMGYGSVGTPQLERLEQVLADERVRGKFRIVVMHHPSAGPHARSRRRGLHDHSAFAAVLARAGAELVLHGHEHLDLRAELAGPTGAPIPVQGVQSGSYAAESERKRARYRIFTIEPSPGGRPRIVREELRTWDGARAAFVAEPVAA